MKKFLKIVGILAAFVLLAAAGLTVFLKVKFPPERLKQIVGEQSRKHLGRDVKLGSVSIGLLRGLAVTGFELSEPPDFAAGRFLASESLSVKPFLLPLLKGQVVIKSVELVRPEVRIVRKADGSFNFSDLAGSTASAKAPAEAPSGPAPQVFVNRLSIEKGVLAYEDRSPARIRAGVRDLDLSVNGFSLLAPFRAELSCLIDGQVQGKPLSGGFAFAGEAALSGEGEARIEKLTVSLLGTSLAAAGTVKNFADPRVELAIDIESFDAKTFSPFAELPPEIMDLQLTGGLAVKGGVEKQDLSGKLKIAAAGVSTGLDFKAAVDAAGKAPAFDASVRFSDLHLEGSPWAPGVKIGGPLNGEALVKGTAQAFSLDLKVQGDGADVSYGTLLSKAAGGALQIRVRSNLKEPFDDPRFQAEGRLEKITLGSGPPFPPELKADGPVSLALSAQGTAGDVALTVELQGRDLAFSYADLLTKNPGTPFSLAAEAALRRRTDLQLKSCRLTLGPLAADLRGKIGDAAGAGKMELSAKVSPFSLDSLGDMVPLMKEYRLSGKAGADVTLGGTFAAPNVRGELSLAGLGAVPMEGLTFSDLHGEASFTESSASLPDLRGKFNGSGLSVKAKVQNFERPDLWCEGSLERLDAGALMAVFSSTAPAAPAAAPVEPPAEPAPLAKTQGSFEVGEIVHPNYLGRRFKLTWDLSEVGPYMGKTDGTADFSAADGKIHDLPLAAKINKLLKKDAADISYSRMSAHFKITQGLLETPDFTVDSSQADILAKGSVHLVTMVADLRAVFKLPAGAGGGSLAEWFTAEDGRPTLEATLKGPLSDPDISVDLSRAAQKAGQELLKKGLEALQGKPAEGEAPAARDERIDKAVEQGQKALEKLFKKKR